MNIGTEFQETILENQNTLLRMNLFIIEALTNEIWGKALRKEAMNRINVTTEFLTKEHREQGNLSTTYIRKEPKK